MLVEFESFFLIGGIFLQLGAFFLKVGGNKFFWGQENQLFWELYGPLHCILSSTTLHSRSLPLKKLNQELILHKR